MRTDEEDGNEIFSNCPFLSLQLKLPELEGLVRRHRIDRSTISYCKAEHVVC